MQTARDTEHRWSARHPIALTVTLYPSGGHSLSGTAQDISLGGMFVQTEAPLPALDTPVSLGFRIGQDGDYWQFSAVMVRATRTGAGLMFDADDETVRSLRQVLDEV